MADCPPFQVRVSGSISDALEGAKQAAAVAGVRFTGNTQKGSFSGRGVIGNYAVSGSIVTVQITELGFPTSLIYDCRSIENKMREFFL